jgi:hypothetical protein
MRGMEEELVCTLHVILMEDGLKDSSFSYCFGVLLSVKGNVVLVIKVGCFL